MERYFSYRGENGTDWVEANPDTAEARMVSRYGERSIRLQGQIYVLGRSPLWNEDDLRHESPLTPEEFRQRWTEASEHSAANVHPSFNWSSMDLQAAQPFWVLRLLPPEQIPQIAYNDLLKGRGGDAVVQLAIMQRPDSTDVSAYFDKAMTELGLPTLSPFAALMTASVPVARSIAENHIHPYPGVRQLLALLYSCYTHEWHTIDALFPFVGLDSQSDDCRFRPAFQAILDDIVEEAQILLLQGPKQ